MDAITTWNIAVIAGTLVLIAAAVALIIWVTRRRSRTR